MLSPGPGTPAEDVARNQRERLFGAMVASVATRGYAATRVTDLIELSGVSRRSFYDLFPDKEACFRAVVEELASRLMRLTDEIEAEGDERPRRRFRALTEMVIAQPAAIRLCLIEAYAAGGEALRPLEETLQTLERRMQAGAVDMPERSGMPAEMIGALIGAALEVVRTRLRDGDEDELREIGPKLMDFLLSYRPPPQPLRLATRPPSPAPETLTGHDHEERALRAFAVVIAERGYANTTIDQVVKRASMSPTTFYANFEGKEDALQAALDSAGAQISAAVLPAFRRNPDWPSAVRAAFGAMFNFLASRPAFAHLLMVDAYAVGPDALERRERALRPVTGLLEEAQQGPSGVPPLAVEAIFGSIYFLAYRQITEAGAEGLPALAPLCTYLALAPFVGAERACEAANGDGRPRGGSEPLDEAWRNRGRVLYILGQRLTPKTSEEVSRELEMPVADVERRLEELELAGLVEPVEEGGNGEGGRSYRATMPLLEAAEWEAMDLPQREKISQHIIYLILEELTRSAETGAFDRRPDRFLTRVVGQVDEQGWRELSKIHDNALRAALEAVARSEGRLRGSAKGGIEVRSIQTLFEMPAQEERRKRRS